jgi:hypothetical protein
VRILVLAKMRVNRGDTDIAHQVQLVAHVPGIAMNDHD